MRAQIHSPEFRPGWFARPQRRGARLVASVALAAWLAVLQLLQAGPPAVSAVAAGDQAGQVGTVATRLAAGAGGAARPPGQPVAPAPAVPAPMPTPPSAPVLPAPGSRTAPPPNRQGAPGNGALGNLKFITPVRVLDTRGPAVGGPIGFTAPGTPVAVGPFQASQTRRFQLAGQTFGSAAQGNQLTLPADLSGVLVNVTLAQGAASGGFVTVLPGDVATPPNASTVNPATAIAANFWATAVPTTGPNAGQVAVFSTNALDLLLDVVGYYSPSNPAPGAAGAVGPLKFITPVRVLDTRPDSGGPIGVNGDGTPVTAGPFQANQTRRFKLAGQTFSGVAFPADVSGIVAHVTLVQGAASGGFVTLFPGDAPGVPNASTVNPSTAIAFNSWSTGIPTGGGNAGTFALFSTNQAHLIVDVVGYYSPSNPTTLGDLSLIAPTRVIDTRGSDVGGPIGFDGNGNPIGAAPFAAGATRQFTLGGKGFPGGSLPADVSGVLANVTIVQRAPSGGFVTAFPGNGTLLPNVSTVNPATAIAASFWANGIASAGPYAGDEAIFSTNALDVIVDVVGYFRPSPPPPAPEAVAPPLPPGSVTDLTSTVSFLYSGVNPIQTGVISGTIVPTRTAVLRGKTLNQAGQPLANVAISILGHPELGQTRTRADGMWDIAVNGGGPLIVNYDREGLLPAQRPAEARWQDFTVLPDVVLVPYDANVTAIDLTSAAPMQVARGSPATDSDGTRRATLFFPAGTQASMKLGDGSTRVLSPTLHVRATEYSVGTSGPAALPAQLPPTVGYTYAASYTVDEAVAMGAPTVNFSQPVLSYLENFLGLPVGTSIPLGSYDTQQGIWVPETNGRVVKVLGIAGQLANLDVDGSGTPASAATLAGLGITDAERAQLAALYQPGQSLWRLALTHFSSQDPCYAKSTPPADEDPSPPPPPPPSTPPDTTCSCSTNGSIIDNDAQSLGEDIPLVGVGFQLHYQSDRAVGDAAARTASLPLVGGSVPAGLKRVDVETQIAGQRIVQSLAAAPNLQTTVTWDGKDAYGRQLPSAQTLTSKISYVYDGIYVAPAPEIPQAFGITVGTPLTTRSRDEVTVTVRRSESLGNLRPASGISGLGGWNLTIQHTYDPRSGSLYLGTGPRITTLASAPFGVTTAAGNGNTSSGANGPALQVGAQPRGLAVGPDGSVYFSEALNNIVRRLGPDGQVVRVAGNGFPHPSGAGDGGPALQAELDSPAGLAIGRDGSLYIADQNDHRIRRVGPDGIITTVAGNLSGFGSFSGDNGPATSAGLNGPGSVAIGPDGSLYIADTGNCRVRRVGGNGSITTVAGNGTCGFAGDGGQATQAQISHVTGVALGPDGSLFLADFTNQRVRRVDPSGRISTVAGNGVVGFTGDGGQATVASLNGPRAVGVAATGELLILDGDNHRVRQVGSDGTISGFAGSGTQGSAAEGQAALPAPFGFLSDLTVGPDGSVYLAESSRLRRVRSPAPGSQVGDLLIPSPDGSEVYRIRQGLHIETLNGLTGVPVFTFAYDAAGRLTSVTDGDGNATTITRDANGAPTAIVAPFGQQTAVALTADGWLASVTNPASETVTLGYAPGGTGLLTSLTDPLGIGHTHTFTYDAKGRLTRDTDPTGGFTNLARTDANTGFTVTATNSLGESSTHTTTYQRDGTLQQTVLHADGTMTLVLVKPSGERVRTAPNGEIGSTIIGPDARFGLLAAIEASAQITTPAGLSRSIQTTTTVVTPDPNNPFALTSSTHNVSTNGRLFATSYLAATRTLTQTSPAGRVSTTVSDPQGRAIQRQTGTFNPEFLTYNARGQLTTITTGTGAGARRTSQTYNAAGFVATATDAEGRQTSYTYDAAGRVTTKTLLGGGTEARVYDPAGNVISLAPPGQPAHTATYDANEQLLTRTLPDVGGGVGRTTTYAYNSEGRITTVTRPDGSTVAYSYDSFGRPAGVTVGGSTRTRAYDSAGRLQSVAAPSPAGAIAVSTAYDGALPTTVTTTGPAPGTIAWQYDTDYRPTSQAVNGGPPITFFYDSDGLLTQAGQLSLTNDPQNGVVTGTSLGAVTDTMAYSGFGEPSSYTANANGSPVYSAQYERDRLGRITTLTETIGLAPPDIYHYTYGSTAEGTPGGRLVRVTRTGSVNSTATYAYDANGNRLSFTGPGGTINGAYDARDRLTQYGTTTYHYTDAGDLQSKTNGPNTTTYQYDALGNLRGATLPNGTTLGYLIDGLDRRVGKQVNGTLVQGFLYQATLQPVAELNGAGAVVSRFVYAHGLNAPEYMEKGGLRYRLIYDQGGSVRLVVDTGTGAVVQRLDYDEYGRVTLDTNPGFQPFGFGGGLYDRDTGLVRFGARDYDPEPGRWTTPDVRGFGGGTNLYVYADDNPVNERDSNGTLSAKNVALGLLAGIALVSGVGAVAAGIAAGVEAVAAASTIELVATGLTSAAFTTGGVIGIKGGAENLQKVANATTDLKLDNMEPTGLFSYATRDSKDPYVKAFAAVGDLGLGNATGIPGALGALKTFDYVANDLTTLMGNGFFAGQVISDVIDWGKKGFPLKPCP